MALCSKCIASDKTTDTVKVSLEQLREEKEARQREAQKAKETEEAEERRRQAKKELERQRAEEARREEEERRKRQEERKSRRKLKIELENEIFHHHRVDGSQETGDDANQEAREPHSPKRQRNTETGRSERVKDRENTSAVRL